MFNHYLRGLATVPRWNVVPVVRRQYVAEHTYFVCQYVSELLDHPYYKSAHPDWKLAALRYALVHDAEEARMSDIPGPVKRMIKDDDKLREVEGRVLASMGLSVYSDEKIKRLVKAADTIDEYFYLCSEAQLGSKIVKVLIGQVHDRMVSALTLAGVPDVLSKVLAQAHKLDDGLYTLSNDDDMRA